MKCITCSLIEKKYSFHFSLMSIKFNSDPSSYSVRPIIYLKLKFIFLQKLAGCLKFCSKIVAPLVVNYIYKNSWYVFRLLSLP